PCGKVFAMQPPNNAARKPREGEPFDRRRQVTFLSCANVCATIPLACPCPIPFSFFNIATRSLCYAGRPLLANYCQWTIGRQYFFSIEGKLEAGPLAGSSVISKSTPCCW